MDFSGGLTSAFLWLLSDRIIYAIFLLALFFVLNFHVYPKLKQAKKMLKNVINMYGSLAERVTDFNIEIISKYYEISKSKKIYILLNLIKEL